MAIALRTARSSARAGTLSERTRSELQTRFDIVMPEKGEGKKDLSHTRGIAEFEAAVAEAGDVKALSKAWKSWISNNSRLVRRYYDESGYPYPMSEVEGNTMAQRTRARALYLCFSRVGLYVWKPYRPPVAECAEVVIRYVSRLNMAPKQLKGVMHELSSVDIETRRYRTQVNLGNWRLRMSTKLRKGRFADEQWAQDLINLPGMFPHGI